MDSLQDIVTRFARALDAEDYAAARLLLHDQCEYECRGEFFTGPEAILASYQENGDAGRNEFDEIAYESSVTVTGDSTAVIDFVDHLTRNGKQLTFRCRQWVEVNPAGWIIRIRHIDLPGEREALAEFREQSGA